MYVVSDNKVALWVRVLACIFLASVAMSIYFIVLDFLETSNMTFGSGFDILTFSYITFLFGWVAITGRPPNKFFPVAGLKWPFFRGPGP